MKNMMCVKLRCMMRPAFFAVLFILLVFPVSASMLSLTIIETGLNSDKQSPHYSNTWEGGLMAVFFDAGHIVTNSPIGRMESKPSNEISGTLEYDFHEALSGGAEYFILGFLDYNSQRGVPESIDVRVYKTDSRQLIYEQTFKAGAGKNSSEEYQIAINAGRVIISQLKDL